MCDIFHFPTSLSESLQALRDNPNLVYHPQRKKAPKPSMKSDLSNGSSDVSPATPISNGRATPSALSAVKNNKLSGGSCINGNLLCAQVPSRTLATPPSGTVILTQAVNARTPQHTSSRNQLSPLVQQTNSNANPSVTMQQMLDLYYTSLCEPAFPEPGEKSTLASPQHYLDQYHLLHQQAVVKQQYGNQSFSTA
ncbi:unnamed protein product [Thelazia callipaeda]|uniref:Protein Smaug n=1 Tax=Thelazia callipaeda TaxID=103827 RepID=A0A0N5DAS6_THECL|nr:unnamed protein product [Thelazia callipaeda]